MSNSHECPSVEQLKQLAVGLLSDPPAGSLEEHLLECDACAQQTAQLQQADTLMAAMKQAGQTRPERSPDEAARLERLMSSLSGLHVEQTYATVLSNPQGPGEATSEADDVTRELSAVWRAPEGGDELGRIGGYRILKVLGAGGMGGVFLAEDMQLRRRVALKLMRPRAAAAPGAAERFLREARAAAALRHDHIITIYQVGEEAGVPFLAMEYLEGESLDDRLRREPITPVGEVLRIGREIAEGLTAAHAKGLIHRDIKPANVWLEGGHLESSPHAPREESRGGTGVVSPSSVVGANDASETLGLPHAEREGYFRVKLLDFGLARSAEADTHLTSSGMIVGTPSYMAPEQASGETVDARVDLFSLGVVLYRMTTGQLPFPGKNVMGILKALATVTPAAPRSINPAVPSELSDLIDRLLAKDRAARPASAREVAKALAKVAESLRDSDSARRMGTLARPALNLPESATVVIQPQIETKGQTGRSARPAKPRRIATALAAVSAVVLLAVVLFVQTRGGTLKIEAGDGIDASVVKEQVTIRDTVSGKTYELSVGENSMRPGQYEIVLRDPASGLKVSTERVEIQRGNSTPLRITLQAELATNSPMKNASRNGAREGEAPAEPRAASNIPTTIGSAGASPSRIQTKPPIKPAVVVPKEGAGSVLTGLQVGPVVNTLKGIIPRPARLPGIARWQAVTAVPRLGVGSVAWSKQGQIFAADSAQLRCYGAASLELRNLNGPLSNGQGPHVSITGDGRLLSWAGHVRRLEDDAPVRVSSMWAPVISPDGKWLAGRGAGDKLVLESVDGTEVRKFDRPGSHVQWSSDSRHLCVLEADHTTVSILNLDGTTAASFATGHTNTIGAMSWSPDGTLLATMNTFEFRIARVAAVDVKNDIKEEAGGKLQITAVESFPLSPLSTLAWSPDSQRLAIGTHHGLLFMDRSGKEVARTATTLGGCGSLAWSPDGREVAAGQGNGLVVWTADGQFARAVYRPNGVHFPNVGVEWNQAGTLAVTADDGTVRLWESTGQPGPLLDAPGTRIRMATWNPQGDKLLTSAEGPSGPVARTWSANGQSGERLAITNGHTFRWHSDGRRIFTNVEGGFWVRDLANEHPVVVKASFPIWSIASQPKGNLLLVGGYGDGLKNHVGLWHDDGTPGPALETESGIVNSVAWHPTEPIFAVNFKDHGVRIGNADGKWLENSNLGGGISPQVAWSPDGQWLAISGGGAVSLRAANGRLGTAYVVPSTITSLAWSPDSRSLAMGLNDHRLIVRDLFAEETKWVVQHLPPQLNAKGEVALHGAAVVFSEAGELLHVAHSVAAKSAGPARATAEPPRNEAATLLDRYAELDGLIYMQVETLAAPGKTQLLKPSEFVKLVEKLAQEPLPSFHREPLDQPIDLLALADPKPPATPANSELRTTVPIATDGEYDLTFSATAPAQPEWLGLGLAWRGRPCEFFVDPLHAGLQRVDSKPSTQNETKVDGRLLSPGAKIELVCQVRHDGLTILSDGEELLKWQGDPTRLSAAEGQSGLGNAMPTLRCPPGWTIHAWTITPRGKGMSPAAGPVLANAKPTAVRQLLDDGYQLLDVELLHSHPFDGDYPAHAMLPTNDRIKESRGTLNSRALQAVGQLSNLEYLGFSGGYLTPEFVTQLNQLTQVKSLDFRQLNIRDEDLATLALSDKLESLRLYDNSVTLTDGLLGQLAGGRSLRTLGLSHGASGNPVSEESLMKLDRLVQLETLILNTLPVTDRVLDRLQTLPNIKMLHITETPATAARVEAFRKAKPNCQVEWSAKK